MPRYRSTMAGHHPLGSYGFQWILGWLALCSWVTAAGPPTGEFRLTAGEYGWHASPVTIDWPANLGRVWTGSVVDTASGQRVPGQLLEETQQMVFVPGGSLAAGESRSYKLETAIERSSSPDKANGVRCEAGEERVTVTIAGKPLLGYRVSPAPTPTGVDPIYSQSGYIHPLRTPHGRAVTSEFPPDHLHQNGVFSGWVNTEFRGHDVDFWNVLKKQGRIDHAKLLRVLSGPVVGEFSARRHFVDKTQDGSPETVIQDDWLVRVFAVEEGRLFDITTRQTCVADAPLLVRQHHYGGMAFRGVNEWRNQPEHNFLTSSDLTRENGNHARVNWVSIHGLVEGKWCGAAVFSHPTNFRSPQPVRLHPSMPYFVFSPPVASPFTLVPGESLEQRFRYYVYDGQPDKEAIAARWTDFVNEPQVEWITAKEEIAKDERRSP